MAIPELFRAPAQWKEGMSPLWDDMAKGNPEVVDALKKVRATLNR